MPDTLDESWQRLSEARIRMPENGLKMLIKSLSKGGIFISAPPRVALHEDGIYISFNANATASDRSVALPIEVFIPCATDPDGIE